MGFLTFTGGEIMVPLDGQHRLKAIQFAITGVDEKSRPIDITPCAELGQEDVTVILVAYEATKARKIFTKVNRYAKTTTTGVIGYRGGRLLRRGALQAGCDGGRRRAKQAHDHGVGIVLALAGGADDRGGVSAGWPRRARSDCRRTPCG